MILHSRCCLLCWAYLHVGSKNGSSPSCRLALKYPSLHLVRQCPIQRKKINGLLSGSLIFGCLLLLLLLIHNFLGQSNGLVNIFSGW